MQNCKRGEPYRHVPLDRQRQGDAGAFTQNFILKVAFYLFSGRDMGLTIEKADLLKQRPHGLEVLIPVHPDVHRHSLL